MTARTEDSVVRLDCSVFEYCIQYVTRRASPAVRCTAHMSRAWSVPCAALLFTGIYTALLITTVQYNEIQYKHQNSEVTST